MRYKVYLDVEEGTLSQGGPLAHIPALPGCTARGRTKEEALSNLKDLLGDYLALFGKEDESLPASVADVELDVEETEALTFPEDKEPLKPEEVGTLLRKMELSRRALLDTVSSLSDEVLAWKRDEDAWPIRQILEHIANAEWWYIQRLQDWPRDPFERLETIHGHTIARLDGLDGEALNRVTAHYNREWTPRKVLRLLPIYYRFQKRIVDGGLAAVADGEMERLSPAELESFQVVYFQSDDQPSDLEPLTPQERDSLLEQLGAASREVLTSLEKIGQLPKEIREWKPKGRTYSLWERVEETADDEWWFTLRLTDWPRDPFERLETIRQMAVGWLGSLAPEELERVTIHYGEEWTARKVLRRFLEHEREHRSHIEEVLEEYRTLKR
ncbi:MAG: DinB family protein [Anaerolineae bacterium]